MAVSITLKKVREAKGISQNELARRSGYSLQNIQKIEQGRAKSIPLETLDKICEILECEVGDLFIRVLEDDKKESLKLLSNAVKSDQI